MSELGEKLRAASPDPVGRSWLLPSRHRRRLAGNPRLDRLLRSLAKRSPKQRAADARVLERVSETFEDGKEITW